MELILGTIFLMLLKVHYTPGLSDWVVFAPITFYIILIMVALGLNLYDKIGKWNERRKRRKDWGE